MTVNQVVEHHPDPRKSRHVQRVLKYDQGLRVEAMLLSLSESRCFSQARDTLLRMGQFAVDHGLDGVLTRGQVSSLRNPVSDRRTLWRHVDLLVECGALEPQEGGAYALTHYLDHNYSAAEREEWLAARRASGRERTNRHRRRGGRVDVKPTSARPTAGTENVEKTGDFDSCNAEGTGSSTSVDSCSSAHECANKQTAEDSEHASDMPSHVFSRERQTKTESRVICENTDTTSDEEWKSMLAAAAARGKEGSVKSEESSSEDPADKEESSDDKPPAVEDTEKYEPARMPADESPVTEHACIVALKTLRKGEPDRQEVDYMRKLAAQLKIRDVELGYAVHRTAAKLQDGGAVHHITHWLVGIVNEQRQHWRRKIERDGCEAPGHLVSLGAPCSWPVRARGKPKKRAQSAVTSQAS